MGLTTIKVDDADWLAFKQAMVAYKDGKAPECRTFWTLVRAIGQGNNELLQLWREHVKKADK